ncbi:MAG: zinc ribbon domain-containing protein [Clostridia bacterium]|nr:zinc ribbon domain-containing protein [Clostridia bacterium]
MKKVFTIITIVIGAIAIICGIICLASSDINAYTSSADTSISFGADYYTESYKAMAKAANNAADAAEAVADFGAAMLSAFGMFFFLSGALVTLKGVKELLVVLADEKANAPAPAFAPAYAPEAAPAPEAAGVFCGNCGAKNEGGEFCANCGNKL